ncbi:MAG TPA: quinoprotein relay system zinc metallohydrolase 2 [Burkholderiales bacterium]|nr:quinoprotein relay system zinc metallohydrolase 2 [Burkholderiales bacterium]
MKHRWLAIWFALAAALPATAADKALPVTPVAEGVFVHYGHQEDSGPGNLGDIANVGFIVGGRCVAVIDTGGTAEVGRRLRAAVEARAPGKPVCYVINTHVHPDHIFGNAAFRDPGTVFVGHARLPAAMAARGGNYLRAMQRDFQEVAAGSEVVPPTVLVQDSMELDLGGRVLTLQAWPTAHTDNDLTVYDSATGTLWLSDLLFVERTPVVDGSLRGWLTLIPRFAELRPRQVVPGHGRVEGNFTEALAAQERYLKTLRDGVRAAIKAGRTLPQAVAEVGASEKGRWLLFDNFNPRNVTAVYAELEWED